MSDINCDACKYSYHTCFGKVGECNNYNKWEPKEDKVNHPKHYNMFCTEVIDVIKSCLTEEEFKGYLKGNMLKYRFRAGFKDNREEDLRKSNWYQDRI